MMSNKDPFTNVTLMVVGFFLGFILCAGARSEGLEGALGVQQAIYTDGSSNEFSFGGKLGHSRVPVYLWGSWEEPTAKVLGQPMGDVTLISVGLGASKEVSEGLSLFVETGYVSTDLSSNFNVTQEISYTALVKNHNVEGRPVPVDVKDYEHKYELDNGVVGRIGAKWQVSDHVAVTGAYKWTYLDQEMAIWDKDSKYPEAGYWREDETLDLSAFEVGLWFTW